MCKNVYENTGRKNKWERLILPDLKHSRKTLKNVVLVYNQWNRVEIWENNSKFHGYLEFYEGDFYIIEKYLRLTKWNETISGMGMRKKGGIRHFYWKE